jgi:hypothetical protein
VSEIAITTQCTINYLVFLNRYDPQPERLFLFPRDKALRWLDQVVCYDEKQVREEHRAALRDLSTAMSLSYATRTWARHFVFSKN